VGIVLFGGALAALLVFLLDLESRYWWLLILGATLAAPLTWWELRRPAPFLDLRMLAANGALTRTYLRQFLVYLSSYAMVYGFSQWLQDAAGYTSDQARPSWWPGPRRCAGRWCWPGYCRSSAGC